MLIYILLIHKDPKQYAKLVKKLAGVDTSFVVHVDKKCPIEEYKSLIPETGNVLYVDENNRVDGRWGDLSLMLAVIECFKIAVTIKRGVFGILLSGQDYPIRSNEYIKVFFLNNVGCNFLSVYPIPDPKKKSENGGFERFVSYTFDCFNSKDPRLKAKIRPLNLNLKTIVGFIRLIRYRIDILPFAVKSFFKKRTYPVGIEQHFNEFWCALNIDTIKWFLEFLNQRPDVLDYYKYTHIPDETMFSSILSVMPGFKTSLKPMCHYIDWNEGKYGSPKTLKKEDVKNIRNVLLSNEHVLFARKFDGDNDTYDAIDQMIEEFSCK